MKNKFSEFLQILTYSSLFVSLCATNLYHFYLEHNQQQVNYYQHIFIFGATLFAYNIVQLNNGNFINYTIDRPKFLQNYRDEIIKLLWVISFILVCLCFFLPLKTLFWYAHLGLLVLLYETFFIKNISLRRIPFLKPFIISYIWAGAISISSFEVLAMDSNLSLSYLDCFLFIFSLTILFDLRDADRDIQTGIKTISTHFSRKTVLTMSSLVFLLSLLTHFYLTTNDSYNWIGLSLLAIIYLSLLPKLRTSAHDFYFLLGIDGLILIKGFC
jgi:hypothetical protein